MNDQWPGLKSWWNNPPAPPTPKELRRRRLEWLSMGKMDGWGRTTPLTAEEQEELGMAIQNGEFS